MRYEDMPSLPLPTTGRERLLETCRAAVTQLELMPAKAYSTAAGTASAAQATALASYFTALAASCTAIATAKTA